MAWQGGVWKAECEFIHDLPGEQGGSTIASAGNDKGLAAGGLVEHKDLGFIGVRGVWIPVRIIEQIGFAFGEVQIDALLVLLDSDQIEGLAVAA